MINYELAKKLKETGFPQSPFPSKNKCPCVDCTIETCGTWVCGHKKEDFITFPTLDELIEACGDEFEGIRKTGCKSIYGTGEKEGWVAFTFNGITRIGLTPSEAMANLWLKLRECEVEIKNPEQNHDVYCYCLKCSPVP